MALTAVQKWMGYFDPCFMGQFDARPERHASKSMNGWVNFLIGGMFWSRIKGGHNLRKTTDGTIPTTADKIVGACHGTASSVATNWLCEKTFDTRYVFGLSAVGAMGVEGPVAAVNEVVFPAGYPMAGTLPNVPSGVTVTGLSNDEFRVDWQYSETLQAVAPVYFRIYYDAGTGTIDEATSIADVDYVAGQRHYSQVITGLSGLPTGKYAAKFVVRAALDLLGTEEKNANVVAAVNAASAVEDTADIEALSGGEVFPVRIL